MELWFPEANLHLAHWRGISILWIDQQVLEGIRHRLERRFYDKCALSDKSYIDRDMAAHQEIVLLVRIHDGAVNRSHIVARELIQYSRRYALECQLLPLEIGQGPICWCTA